MNKEVILKQIEDILKADYSDNIVINQYNIKYDNIKSITEISFDIKLEDYSSIAIKAIFKYTKDDCWYKLSLVNDELDQFEISLSSDSNIFEVASVCKLISIYQDFNLYTKKFVLQLRDIIKKEI